MEIFDDVVNFVTRHVYKFVLIILILADIALRGYNIVNGMNM